MSRLDLASLQVGDVIEVTQTVQVTRVTQNYVEVNDVQSLYIYGYAPSDVDGSRSTRKLTMVKRAVRKPKVGDVITARELRDIQWKRGTLIQVSLDGGTLHGATYMLTAEGTWISAGGTKVKFSDFRGDFKLLHVA